MAENQEHSNPKEREIPVFTVLKNNCILKNIFLLDRPPSTPVSENAADRDSEVEEILVMGRHPDCNIKLEHPSISRFHLRIHSKPSSRSLHVTDLSSVHGTWISGERIEPGARTKLKEGDTLQLGTSSRLYKLYWVPISRAYDIDKPFVPQLDEANAVEEQQPSKATYEDESTLLGKNDQVETMGDHLEGLERLFSDTNFGSSVQKTSPVSPLVSQDLHNRVSIDEIEKCSSSELYSEENDICINELHLSEQEKLDTSENSSKKKSGVNISSRRGKPEEGVRIGTIRFRGKSARIINTSSQVEEESLADEYQDSEAIPMYIDDEDEKFMKEKENASPYSLPFETSKREKGGMLKKELVLSTPVSSVDLNEETFTPDKENMSPGSRLVKPSTSKHISSKHQNSSHRSSPLRKVYNSNMLPRSLEASQHGEVFQEWKSANSATKRHDTSKKELPLSKGIANKEPFYPLPLESLIDHKSNSKPSACEDDTMRGRRPKKNNTTEVTEDRWIMVVDTASLLDKKSRKELKLLCGLRGTNLIIPRIVVRELDCMLRRGSLFTRTGEVYEALQFIEESMAVAQWWIHVQSSAEEVGLLPPTPPASSPHWPGESTWAHPIGSSTPFFPGKLREIVTPTAGDHILDYALRCRRIRKDGRLVLLSDDVTLKIKAMAEGVLCERAQEFRRSLVNPFSARFLYSSCAPIGPNWTCKDDVVLKEKYYPSPSKKATRSSGGVRGLKLILMHNSSFRPIR